MTEKVLGSIFNKTFGVNVCGAMLDCDGMNISKLARQCGVSYQTMSRIINGKSQPHLQLACKIANVLSVNISDLTKERDSVYP